ncbi:MAG: NACHT domain-containing protein [Streptosporangiales bacterium]|nr:NACHT domain-containing protein [Streptosporangiales bacterium]
MYVCTLRRTLPGSASAHTPSASRSTGTTRPAESATGRPCTAISNGPSTPTSSAGPHSLSPSTCRIETAAIGPDNRLNGTEPNGGLEDRARKGLLGGYSVAPVSYQGGDLHTIGAYFGGLRPRRLLVVGEPGAGKTVLAIELVLQLLEPYLSRPAGTPMVPVRLNAARWTLGAPFETWLADQLVRDFGLAAADAERLVRDRHVLPVLDGLDELDPGPSKRPRRAIALLTELNRYSHRSGRQPGPLVVTCRADRYAELAEARTALDSATLIRLDALTPEQIGGFLRNRWPDGHPRAADGEVVRAAPAEPAVYAAPATPWRLLLTVTAVESGTDPAVLVHAGRPADGHHDEKEEASARIVRRLLAAYIPAATRLTPHDGGGAPYRPEEVRAWLTNLAERLRFQATETAELGHLGLTPINLVPHLLWPVGGRRRVQLLHGLCGALLACAAMAAFWAGSGIDADPLMPALMVGWVVIATRLALSRWPVASGGRADVPLRRRLTGGLLGGAAGLLVGVLGGLTGLVLTGGQVFGLAFALPSGAAGGTVLGAVIGVTAARPASSASAEPRTSSATASSRTSSPARRSRRRRWPRAATASDVPSRPRPPRRSPTRTCSPAVPACPGSPSEVSMSIGAISAIDVRHVH